MAGKRTINCIRTSETSLLLYIASPNTSASQASDTEPRALRVLCECSSGKCCRGRHCSSSWHKHKRHRALFRICVLLRTTHVAQLWLGLDV
jgi:hypothetical protein